MKTSLIVAMGCALACSASTAARECPAGKAMIWEESSQRHSRPPQGAEDWDRSVTTFVIGLEATAAPTPFELTRDYRVRDMQMHITYGTRPPVVLRPVAGGLHQQGGCVQFEAHAVERPTRVGIDRVEGNDDVHPTLCMQGSGRVNRVRRASACTENGPNSPYLAVLLYTGRPPHGAPL